MNSASATDAERISGVLLGTAVGDALGLPAEGLRPQRIQRRWKGDWKMRLVAGRGMVSDDTEHTAMVAAALLEEREDAIRFQRAFAWKLRWWFLALPVGVGMATARACIKLWLGFPPNRSGVHSAGNGPAMRSAILGAVFPNDEIRRRKFTKACSMLTHTDERAVSGALLVVEAVAWLFRTGSNHESREFLELALTVAPHPEWQESLRTICSALESGRSVSEFAQSIGLANGVTGYILHTVPVVLYAWLRHRGEFRVALTAALDCGGDTDTVGAIVGAILGAEVGAQSIPEEWLSRVADWPHSVTYLRRIGIALGQSDASVQVPGLFWPAIPVRNLAFLAIVLTHGFRRLVPP